MKKVKLIFWLLIIGLAVLIMYQNRSFVIDQHTFGIDLGLYSYQTPPVWNIALLLGFFAAGLVLAILFMLPGRFKAKKTAKDLTQQIKLQKEKSAALEQQLQEAQARISSPDPVPTAPSAPDSTD